ncbi:MAG: hypothetical protein OEZ34_12115 [Spirochaetia bacterium]|nr:hypothetical protein [Spirochaetia bacterium]
MKLKRIRKRTLTGIIIYASAALLAYSVIFSPKVTEYLIRTAFQFATDAEIELRINRSSLFYGFDISKIRVLSVNREPIFTAEHILLTYSFFSLLIGHAGVRKLEIDSPSIYIIKKNGIWNTDSLFTRSTEIEDETSEEVPEFIHFFYPFKFYLNLTVKNLSFHYSNPDDHAVRVLDIKNINLFAVFLTKTISGIPVSDEILNIFQVLTFGINSFNTAEITVKGGNHFSIKPDINWFLFHDNTIKNIFLSHLEVKSQTAREQLFHPEFFSLVYNLKYNAKKDTITLQNLNFKILDKNHLQAKGEIKNFFNNVPHISLSIYNSKLYLGPAYRILQSWIGMANDPLLLDSEISQIEMNGTPDRLEFSNSILISRMYTGMAGFPVYIRNFINQSDGIIDLYTVFPLKRKPENYLAEKNLAFGTIYSMNIPVFSMFLNEARISINGNILPETGISLNVNMLNLNISPLTAPNLSGYLNGNIILTSDETFENLSAITDLKFKNGRFMYGRSLSKPADYSIRGPIGIHTDAQSTEITSSGLSVDGKNYHGKKFLDLNTSTRIQFLTNFSSYQFNNLSLSLMMQDLYPLLPGELQHEISPAKKILSKGIVVNSKYLVYNETKTSYGIKSSMNIEIPFLHLEDLFFQIDLDAGPAVTLIRSLKFDALKSSLKGSMSGRITETAETLKPNLKFNIYMNNSKLLRVHQNVLMKGGLDINFSVNEISASGRILMKGLDIQYEGDHCEPADRPECFRYFIHDLNLDLPFQHDMRYSASKLPIRAPVIPAAASYEQNQPNFYAQYISSSHNPRGEYMPDGFYFTGNKGIQRPGLSGKIQYLNNTLEIPWIKTIIFSSTRGKKKSSASQTASIDGRNIKFHLADLEPRNMRLFSILKISNLDLEPFLPGSSVKYDGRISADLKANCTDLDDVLNHTNARLSIYQLSPRFSGFATRIVMPDQFTARLVRGTLKIPSISLEMKEGLMYSSIKFERGGIFPGLFILPSGDKISQERVPLARFVERAKSEASEIVTELKSEEAEE